MQLSKISVDLRVHLPTTSKHVAVVKQCDPPTHYDEAKGECVQDCLLGSFVRMGVVGAHVWVGIEAVIVSHLMISGLAIGCRNLAIIWTSTCASF